MKRNVLLTLLVLVTAGTGGLQARRVDPPALPRPTADLVTEIDQIIQTRFQTIRDEDIRNGRVGVSRIIDFRSPHGLALRPENKEEKKAVDRLKAEGWIAGLYIGTAGRGGLMRGEIKGPVVPGGENLKAPEDKTPFRDLAKRSITEVAVVAGATDELVLEARPVLASTALCLSCHRGKKLGDPLGAVVYAFRRDVTP